MFRELGTQVKAVSKKVYEGARQHLVASASMAASWYPIHLAINDVPAGYGGIEHASSFRLSGVEIYLDARREETFSEQALSGILIESLGQPRTAPTCSSPYIATGAPVYAFFGERGIGTIAKADARNELFLPLVDKASSPFELKELWDLQRRLKLDSREHFRLFLGKFVDRLQRMEVDPIGMSVLNVRWAFHDTVRGLLAKAESLGIPHDGLLSAYRGWLTRSYGAPICSDPALSRTEQKARDEAVRIANGILKGYREGNWALSEEELTKLRKERGVDKQPAWHCPRPEDVDSSFISLGEYVRSPGLAATRPVEMAGRISNFEIAWRKWSPRDEGVDPRNMGTKLAPVMALIRLGPPPVRKPMLELAIQYLTNHPGKRAFPAIWATYVLSLKSFVSGSNPWGIEMSRDDSSMKVLADAPDATIRLLATYDQKR